MLYLSVFGRDLSGSSLIASIFGLLGGGPSGSFLIGLGGLGGVLLAGAFVSSCSSSCERDRSRVGGLRERRGRSLSREREPSGRRLGSSSSLERDLLE